MVGLVCYVPFLHILCPFSDPVHGLAHPSRQEILPLILFDIRGYAGAGAVQAAPGDVIFLSCGWLAMAV